jgi:hypothetical protein
MMEAVRVFNRAKIKNIGKRCAGNVEWDWQCACSEQNAVVGDFFAVIQGSGMPGGVKVRDTPAGAEFDLVFRKPAHRQRREMCPHLLFPQILFAQRRAMVRTIDFLPDQQDRSFAIDLTDRLSGGAAGHAAADQKISHVEIAHDSVIGPFSDASVL